MRCSGGTDLTKELFVPFRHTCSQRAYAWDSGTPCVSSFGVFSFWFSGPPLQSQVLGCHSAFETLVNASRRAAPFALSFCTGQSHLHNRFSHLKSSLTRSFVRSFIHSFDSFLIPTPPSHSPPPPTPGRDLRFLVAVGSMAATEGIPVDTSPQPQLTGRSRLARKKRLKRHAGSAFLDVSCLYGLFPTWFPSRFPFWSLQKLQFRLSQER